MAENNIENILAAATKVLMFPSTTLQSACAEYGVNISTVSGIVLGGMLSGSPLLMGAAWLVGKYKESQREQQEKDRMKNEIIRNQQAVVNKLKRGNELNKQEIKNLKETLQTLEELLRAMNREAA